MTLTIKDSTDPASPSKPTLQAPNPGQKSSQTPRSNPVCLEVGVTIRSLPTESSSAFQPIREDGRTVIVFDNGAVLRSTSNFPVGQTVILSNPSGRDVICKIVGARNMPSIKGYVEVEFIEPVDDFWHIHQQIEPTHTVTAQPAAAPPASEKPATVRTGSGPSFDDIAGVMSPSNGPTTREKRFEPAKPVGEARAKSELAQTPSGSSGPASSSSAQGFRSESRNDMGEMQAARETASQNSLSSESSPDFVSDGLLGSTHTSTSSSSIFTDGMPLRIAASALLLAVIGGGMYFMQRNSAPVHVAQGSVTNQPSLPGSPTAGAINSDSQTVAPAQVRAPDALQAAKAQPAVALHAEPVASIAAAPSSSVAKDLPSAQRQDKSTQDKSTSADKASDAPSPRKQAISNLKMKSPSAPKPNLAGQSEAPTLVAEIAPPAGAGGASSAGLLSSVVHSPNQPPPPPSGQPAKANRDAKLISSAHPVYPQAAKVANIQGSVVVLASIDPHGNVVDVRAESGPMLLRQAALESVRRWKYSPALADGKPVSAQVAIAVDFKLK